MNPRVRLEDRADTIAAICELLGAGDEIGAAARTARDYPFEPTTTVGRKYGLAECTKLFVRDGFTDRYSGSRLIFPGALRVLSLAMPSTFPFQSNWKMSETHVAYWELTPTLDHIIPIARGGADDESNWATTSMLRNSAKSNWTLEELGWMLHPPGNSEKWDGLLGWFVKHIDANPHLMGNTQIRRWRRVADDSRR